MNPRLERVGQILTDILDFALQILRSGLDHPVSLILDHSVQREGDSVSRIPGNLRDHIPDYVLRQGREGGGAGLDGGDLVGLPVALVGLVLVLAEDREGDPDDEAEAGDVSDELEHENNIRPDRRDVKSPRRPCPL